MTPSGITPAVGGTEMAKPASSPGAGPALSPSAADEFARIDAADRVRSAVRTKRLEKTLEEQRSGEKNDPLSRWQRAGVMAEQLGQQDHAPPAAVRGKPPSPPPRLRNRNSSSSGHVPTVDSLSQQLLGTSFFDKLPFTFKNEAEKKEFIRESKTLTKRMEDQNWLEMLDPKHRYGSNLKHYHRHWNLKADTRQNFLHWLDEGEGKHLSLEECPRSKLEAELITYLTPDERRNYLTYVDNEVKLPPNDHLHDLRTHLKSQPGRGRLRWCRSGELVNTSKYDHGDLGRGRGVALRESQEWQNAVARGEACDVLRDDKIKFRRTTSASSSDSFTSNSALSDEDLSLHHESSPEASSHNRTSASPSVPTSTRDPDEKQQSRKEKLLEKANLGPKYLLKHKLGLYSSSERQQMVKGEQQDESDGQSAHRDKDALIRKRKADTWIFVTDLSYNMYIGIKQRGRFQHSSLLAGSLVTVAGVLKVKDGVIVSIYPWSGHYRSSSQHFEEFVRRLQERGLDTSQINVTKSKWVIEVVNRYGTYRKKKDRKLKDVKDKVRETWDARSSPSQPRDEHV